MAFSYGTLAQEVGGKVEYFYPKTTADVVEYNDVDSVKTKIEKLEQEILSLTKRIEVMNSEFGERLISMQNTISELQIVLAQIQNE